MAYRTTLVAACTVALALAAAPVAARPAHPHHRRAAAALPEATTVTVHRGFRANYPVDGARDAEAGAPWFGAGAGYAPAAYWGVDDVRVDDAALFAERYGCVGPIWNAKSNRYMSPCN